MAGRSRESELSWWDIHRRASFQHGHWHGSKSGVSNDRGMLEMLGADNRREVKKPEETALGERVQQKD